MHWKALCILEVCGVVLHMHAMWTLCGMGGGKCRVMARICPLDCNPWQHGAHHKQQSLCSWCQVSMSGARQLEDQCAQAPGMTVQALSGIVGSLSKVPALQVLGSNKLAEVPFSLTQLPRLARLDLSANLLVNVPPTLGHIKALKELDLRQAAPVELGERLMLAT